MWVASGASAVTTLVGPDTRCTCLPRTTTPQTPKKSRRAENNLVFIKNGFRLGGLGWAAFGSSRGGRQAYIVTRGPPPDLQDIGADHVGPRDGRSAWPWRNHVPNAKIMSAISGMQPECLAVPPPAPGLSRPCQRPIWPNLDGPRPRGCGPRVRAKSRKVAGRGDFNPTGASAISPPGYGARIIARSAWSRNPRASARRYRPGLSPRFRSAKIPGGFLENLSDSRG